MGEKAGQDVAPLMLSVSGCRGIVGRSLTGETVARYCGALGAHLRAEGVSRGGRVVLARDGRVGGAALYDVASGALRCCGFEVLDLGVATTPTAGVVVRAEGADAGLVLTASHNPGEWNGLKPITREGAAPGAEEAGRLIERYREGASAWVDAASVGGAARVEGAAARHVEAVLGALGEEAVGAVRARGYRVVLDAVNCSGGEAGLMLLEGLGCAVTALHADGSGVFPHTPEPTESNVVGLRGAVTGAGADVGFAQDPDADRLAIVSGSGAYIGEEYTLTLCARWVLERGGGAGSVVVANLSTSRMIDDVAARFGGRVERSAVGEANVWSRMKAGGAVLGGEGNGGVIWPAVGAIRDSVAAMGMTLALMAATGEGVDSLAGDFPRYAIEKRKSARPDAEDLGAWVRGAMSEAVERAVASVGEVKRVDREDGVRVDLEVGGGAAWVHVRPSNTEPIVRLIAEAPDAAGASALLDAVEGAVSGAR